MNVAGELEAVNAAPVVQSHVRVLARVYEVRAVGGKEVCA